MDGCCLLLSGCDLLGVINTSLAEYNIPQICAFLKISVKDFVPLHVSAILNLCPSRNSFIGAYSCSSSNSLICINSPIPFDTNKYVEPTISSVVLEMFE